MELPLNEEPPYGGRMVDTMKENNTEYASIDATRLFFCICIVFLHSGTYHLVPGEWFVLQCLLRLAVPFFFVVSGYFWGGGLRRDSSNLRERLIHYEKRLLFPYIVFSIPNIILAVWEMVLSEKGKLKLGILLGIALYCMALVMNSYYFLIEGTKLQRFMDIYLKNENI